MIYTILIILAIFSLFGITFSKLYSKIQKKNTSDLTKSQNGKKPKFSKVQFYARGKDLGFSIAEINMLETLAKNLNVENSSALFWSQNMLEDCIRTFIKNIRVNGLEDHDENQELLEKLFEFRKKIELEKPRNKNGLNSTLQIMPEQNVRAVINNVGIFYSKVTNNTAQSISIVRPQIEKLPLDFDWIGKKLVVYFWRERDAGYVFETTVKEVLSSDENSILKCSHSEKLVRTQKRRNLRIQLSREALMYALEEQSPNSKHGIETGVSVTLDDLSDTGCAICIKGKIKTGLRVIVTFILDGTSINMSGVIRHVEYDLKTDTSKAHIESDLIPRNVKNTILGVMFGVVDESSNILPLQAMEKELENEDAPSADNEELEAGLLPQ